jgi:4-hydroxythreonine-4-phosphate dehydrogenase
VVVLADISLLAQRAEQLQMSCELQPWSPGDTVTKLAGQLSVFHIPLKAPCTAGTLDTANASYVLAQLQQSVQLVQSSSGAIVTCPVHKGVINDSGIAFSGHTEFFAEQASVEKVVMMLACEKLRVCLATTHLPLRAVADAINDAELKQVLGIIHRSLQTQFGIAQPKISVCGLNPHAGEGGHLGYEEQAVIEPALDALRSEGLDLIGPLPADTAFTPRALKGIDAVLAMYHDQGLPVLKYAGFGDAVNVTLGLPFIRTSVDHGTALDIAGSGLANCGSLRCALEYAATMSANSNF